MRFLHTIESGRFEMGNWKKSKLFKRVEVEWVVYVTPDICFYFGGSFTLACVNTGPFVEK